MSRLRNADAERKKPAPQRRLASSRQSSSSQPHPLDSAPRSTPFSSLNPCGRHGPRTFPGRAQSFFPLLRLPVSFKPHRREAELLPARTARPPQKRRPCLPPCQSARSVKARGPRPRHAAAAACQWATRPKPTRPEAAARAGTASAGAEPAQQLVRWGVRPSEHRARSRGFTEPASQPHVRVWPAEAVPAPPQAH